jgi:hypothetical protein
MRQFYLAYLSYLLQFGQRNIALCANHKAGSRCVRLASGRITRISQTPNPAGPSLGTLPGPRRLVGRYNRQRIAIQPPGRREDRCAAVPVEIRPTKADRCYEGLRQPVIHPDRHWLRHPHAVGRSWLVRSRQGYAAFAGWRPRKNGSCCGFPTTPSLPGGYTPHELEQLSGEDDPAAHSAVPWKRYDVTPHKPAPRPCHRHADRPAAFA